MTELVLRPGDSVNESLQKGTEAGIAVWTTLVFGRDHGPTPAGAGSAILPHLIPGAKYAIRAEGKLGWPQAVSFTAPRAGSLDLGVVAIDPRK
jgi:hypothetical protein